MPSSNDRGRGTRDASGAGPRRPGLPSPDSVVEEFLLTPPADTRARAAAAVAPSRVYRVLRTDQVDEYEAPVSRDFIPTAPLAAPRRRGDSFAGTARRAAKISIAPTETEEFRDLKALIESLPPDRDMARRQPRIEDTARSGRVAEENRNVRVRAFLYAASREDDNDFHLILGRSPRSAPMYMTMEISGLPPSSSPHRATLQRVRDTYKQFFQGMPNGLPGTSYDFYDPPIPVEIGGSLFFDVNHATGSKPGPRDLRPNILTVWEVHPVTTLVFEP